jgi:hypothetical protein
MTDSPFPGMDPYLEYHWRSVHHRLITYLGDQLQSVLPPAFRVEVESCSSFVVSFDSLAMLCLSTQVLRWTL